MIRNYTLTVDLSMPEPKDYEEFKWWLVHALETCADGESVVFQSVHLKYREDREGK